MKKIVTLALVMLLATVASAFADTEAPATANSGLSIYARIDQDPTGTESTDPAATLIGKLSTGVYAGWNTDASNYVILTMHFDGNRAFGTSADATALYRNDTKPTAAPSESTKAYFGASWTAM